MDWRETFTAKLGPLPAWVWGVMLGGGILAAKAVMRARTDDDGDGGGGGDAEPGPTPATGGGAAEPVSGLDAGYFDAWEKDFALSPSPMGGGSWAVAPSTSTGSTSTGTTTTTAPTTNGEWQKLAADYLIANSLVSATVAVDSVAKYVEGQPMTAAEVAAVNAAVRAIGAPPQGVPTIVRVPEPGPSTPPTPAAKVPSAPQQLRLTRVGADRVTVSWAPPASNGGAPVTRYVVERSFTNGTSWQTVGAPPSSPMTGAQLAPYPTETLFRVTAENKAGRSPSVSARLTATPAAQKPGPVVNLAAKRIAAGTIRVSWKAPSSPGVTRYLVDINRNGQWQPVAPGASWYADAKGLTPGTRYSFRVAAVSPGGTGPYLTATAAA